MMRSDKYNFLIALITDIIFVMGDLIKISANSLGSKVNPFGLR